MARRPMLTNAAGLQQRKRTWLPRRKYNKVDLEGLEDLEAALGKLKEDVRGRQLREAAKAGAEITRDLAAQLAPRSADGSHGRPPGFLSRNIKVEVQWTRTQDKADVFVGMHKDAFYGWFQETGTIYDPAQPFLRPALDATKDDVVDEIGDYLRSGILGTRIGSNTTRMRALYGGQQASAQRAFAMRTLGA